MHARLNAQFCKVLLVLGAITLFHWSEASGKPVSSAELVATTKPNKHYTVNTFRLPDGTMIEEGIINGPPTPPPGFEIERQAVTLPEPDSAAGISILGEVPAFNWVFGCSAVSGAMIAGYYDRTGFPNMYTGPTNSGVMPLNNSSWPTWSDGDKTYPNCPLIASHNGVDGRAIKGSIDDYWVLYGSSADDPYITGGWAQHTWGDAIGDYMWTSQSAFGNTDGSTNFWTYTSSANQLTCDYMVSHGYADGTLGRKYFYEARGYAVTACYNQKTDNKVTGGFSFAQFKAEIDAGRPVMLNLYGHTIVGVGYDDSSNTVYIHDTWDYNNHTFTWGTSYSGMELLSVSIVNVAIDNTPPTVTVTSPADGGTEVEVTDPITATFSRAMNAATITSANFYLNNGVTGSVSYDWTTKTATLTPSTSLAPNTLYTATITTGVTDAAGNHMTSTKTWNFTTGAGTNLIVNGGFENGLTGWATAQVQTSGTAGAWTAVSSGAYPATSPHGGAKLARFNSYDAAAGNQTRLYQTTGFAIPSSSTASSLTFWMSHDTHDTSSDQLQVQISTDGSTWSNLGSPVMRYDGTTGWSQVTRDLSAYSGQSNVRIGFLGISAYGDDIYLDDLRATVTIPLNNTLTVNISGNGSVNSDALHPGIACASGSSANCSHSFPSGAQIVLTPTASSDSMFMTWPVGGCTSESNGNCNITLTADKSITATFIILPPVFTGGSYYGSLQDAYNGGGTSCAIKAKAVVLPALDFTLDSVLAKTVTLEGGYDSTYSLKNDYTTLQGILTLKTGSLTLENLIIK